MVTNVFEECMHVDSGFFAKWKLTTGVRYPEEMRLWLVEMFVDVECM